MRIRIDTFDELDALPYFAVVYDHDNKTWQYLPPGALQGRSGGWATPGISGVFPVDDVCLPAYLLDDGL